MIKPYVGLIEAVEIARKYFPDSTFCENLDDERRQALIELATMAVNAVATMERGMGYKGRKLELTNEFPRDLYPIIPFEVKLACVCEAAMQSGSDADRLRLRRQGVIAVDIGGARERYGCMQRSDTVISREAMSYLIPFTNRAEAAEVI